MGGLHVSHLWLFIAFIPINTDNRCISPQLGRLPSGGKLDNRAPGPSLLCWFFLTALRGYWVI